MSAADEAQAWAAAVQALAGRRELRYEPVGGINPADAPAALCVGGANRLTGELAEGFWGSSCDADERPEGRFLAKALLPHAVLCKSHMPDLAAVMPAFNVESIEARPDEFVIKHVARKVEFESIEFNKRFLATVPSQYDPVALRELFSPGFLDWVTTIANEIDFGVSECQLWFSWRLRDRSSAELEAALDAGGQLFRRVQREMDEHGVNTYPPGPWHAGLEPFPSSLAPPRRAQ
ncbi:MAG: hypothetical protein QOG09_1267 [Solirubrobacterales bacterium]|nr:hypothetical protein [Solirubrobacterales bacterium]